MPWPCSLISVVPAFVLNVLVAEKEPTAVGENVHEKWQEPLS